MSKSVRYQGPLPLLQAKSKLICTPLDDSRFHREGPRANVEYRDLRVVIPVVLQFWLYAAPVVYPVSALPQRYRVLAQLNPMTGVVDGFRNSLTAQPIPWGALAYSTIAALVLLVSGAYYFRRMERQFADVL